MKIREAKPEEAFTVANFMTKFEEETVHVKVDPVYAGKMYANLIEHNIGHIFILETEDGIMVGGLACIVGPDLHFPRKVAVETCWYVDPMYRGSGLLLLKYFEQWAKDNYCDIVAMIHLSDSMPDSLEHLYTRRGYRLVEKHYIREV